MSDLLSGLLIPCYNAERYLPNLLTQVKALNPAFDEVLLVDDGSTDGTVEKARDLGFTIHPLGFNRGPGGARNALLGMTSAEWIHFLDADDEIPSNYLHHVLPLVGDEVDVIVGACDFIGAADRKLWVRWTFEDMLFRSDALAAAIARPVFMPCSFVRRSKALEAGGFDEEHRCYEDGDFHVRLAAAGARFRCIPDVLAVSLRHSEGAGGNELYCSRCRLEFLKAYRQYLGRIPVEVLTQELAECGAVLHRNGDGDGDGSREAFAVAFDLGWRGPISRHWLVRALAALPNKHLRRSLYLWQHKVRLGK
jgi:glycosyltransferase involved in cell wall biosynthesis